MALMCKNGDLDPFFKPDCTVVKEDVVTAMLARGVRLDLATETTEANFNSTTCPKCPTNIDVRAMDTITTFMAPSPNDAPQEHMYSTGIRDPVVGFGAFNFGEVVCLAPNVADWTEPAVNCLWHIWDRRAPDPPNDPITTNDVDTDKLDQSLGVNASTGLPNCQPQQSGCPSQLSGSNLAFFHALAPTGVIPAGDFKDAWLSGIYPPDFLLRDPTFCATSYDPLAGHGCQDCLALVVPSQNHTAERYCNCIHQWQLNTSVLASILPYQAICPPLAGSGRRLQGPDANEAQECALPDDLDSFDDWNRVLKLGCPPLVGEDYNAPLSFTFLGGYKEPQPWQQKNEFGTYNREFTAAERSRLEQAVNASASPIPCRASGLFEDADGVTLKYAIPLLTEMVVPGVEWTGAGPALGMSGSAPRFDVDVGDSSWLVTFTQTQEFGGAGALLTLGDLEPVCSDGSIGTVVGLGAVTTNIDTAEWGSSDLAFGADLVQLIVNPSDADTPLDLADVRGSR